MLVWVSNGPVRDDDGAVVGVVGVSLDITALRLGAHRPRRAAAGRARPRERLADRNARLVRISEALGRRARRRRRSPRSSSAQAVEALRRRRRRGRASSTAGRLRVLAARGLRAGGRRDLRVAAAGGLDARSPTCCAAARRCAPSRAQELRRRSTRDLPHSSLSESIACVPLEVEGRVLGVLVLSSVRPAAFADDDLVFLLTLARQGAQAMERGRLLAAEREARRRVTLPRDGQRPARRVARLPPDDRRGGGARRAGGRRLVLGAPARRARRAAARDGAPPRPRAAGPAARAVRALPARPRSAAPASARPSASSAPSTTGPSPTRSCGPSPATRGTTTRCAGSASAARWSCRCRSSGARSAS